MVQKFFGSGWVNGDSCVESAFCRSMLTNGTEIADRLASTPWRQRLATFEDQLDDEFGTCWRCWVAAWRRGDCMESKLRSMKTLIFTYSIRWAIRYSVRPTVPCKGEKGAGRDVCIIHFWHSLFPLNERSEKVRPACSTTGVNSFSPVTSQT